MSKLEELVRRLREVEDLDRVARFCPKLEARGVPLSDGVKRLVEGLELRDLFERAVSELAGEIEVKVAAWFRGLVERIARKLVEVEVVRAVWVVAEDLVELPLGESAVEAELTGVGPSIAYLIRDLLE